MLSPTYLAMVEARARARKTLRETEPHMIRGTADENGIRDRLNDLAKVQGALSALSAAMIADLNVLIKEDA